MKRSEILQELMPVFVPHGLAPETGDFLNLTIDPLRIIRDSEMLCVASALPEEKIEDVLDQFHAKLLVVAEEILGMSPFFYPYAAVLAAYVLRDSVSPSNSERAAQLFDRLDSRLQDNEDVEGILTIKFEAYHCAGRIMPFESAYSYSLHAGADMVLYGAFLINQSVYSRLIQYAAKSAAQYPVGKALLLANYELVIGDCLDANESENVTTEQIVNNLIAMTRTSAHLAMGTPEQSGLVVPAIRYFNRSWDKLYSMDAETGRKVLGNCIKTFNRMNEGANKGFADVLNGKIRAMRETESRCKAMKLPRRPADRSSGGASQHKVARPR